MDPFQGQQMQGNSGTMPYTYGGAAGLGSATWTASVAPATESGSPVRDRLSGTEQWLSGLHQAVDALEKRLDTILTPIPLQGNAAQGSSPTPTQIKSHMQGRMDILNEGFAHLNARLNQLLNRVEL